MPHHTVNGIEIYYEITGEGRPLLLIHGLGSSLRDWEKQVPVFAQHYRVITCDARGHGSTSKPPGPYSLPMMAEDIAQLIQVLDIERLDIVGVSMGGMIAYQLAVCYPQMFEHLVVTNCSPELKVNTFWDRVTIWQREVIVRLIGMRKMGEVLSKKLFINPEQEDIRRIFVERWAENDRRAYLASMRALVGWSVVDQLDKLTMPVLVIAADEDYTFMGDKAAFLDKTPNANMVVIEDSRHATPAEHPEQFNQVVLDFLS